MGCGAVRPQGELLRLAVRSGRVVRDERAALPGRGAYVCGPACFERATASRALPRAFRQPVQTGGDTLESLDD